MSPSLDRLAERFTQLLGQTAVPSRSPVPESVVPAAAAAGSPGRSSPGPVQRVDHALKATI